MRTGTKSILFGVHQFLWHPWTVARAWRARHGRWPRFYEAVAILAHDWGYWGCKEMDGPDGKVHPWVGAKFMHGFVQSVEALCGRDSFSKATQEKARRFYYLVLFHSRSMAEMFSDIPSELCGPDKESLLFDPLWFYYIRGTLSGEINEYRLNAIRGGYLPRHTTNWEWLKWYHGRVASGTTLRERPTS